MLVRDIKACRWAFPTTHHQDGRGAWWSGPDSHAAHRVGGLSRERRTSSTAAQAPPAAITYPTIATTTRGGPRPPCAATKKRAVRATAVGPRPKPTATFTKKLIEVTRPRR